MNQKFDKENPGKGGGGYENPSSREIRYTLDGEDRITVEREMTAEQLLRAGGVDPSKYYLVLQRGNGNANVSYKDNPTELIKLHNNMVFLANYRGATTVS